MGRSRYGSAANAPSVPRSPIVHSGDGGVGGFVVGSQFSSDQSWANGGSCPFSPQTTDTRTVHIYMHTALGSILLACVFRAHSLRESGCGDVSATAPRFVGFGLRAPKLT